MYSQFTFKGASFKIIELAPKLLKAVSQFPLKTYVLPLNRESGAVKLAQVRNLASRRDTAHINSDMEAVTSMQQRAERPGESKITDFEEDLPKGVSDALLRGCITFLQSAFKFYVQTSRLQTFQTSWLLFKFL